MKKILEYRHFNFIIHALAWSIVLLLPYLVSDAGSQYQIGLFPGRFFTFTGIVHMFIFYVHSLFLFPKWLNRKYWYLYIASAIILVFLSVKVKLIMLAWFPNTLTDARSHLLFPSVLVFIVSVFYSIVVEKVRVEKRQKEQEALQLEMELKFLRSQINPHFLFNVLTNLVSLARKKSDQIESSLLMLSGLMRYMLYDAAHRIPLQQEAEFLENYIALQKLRYGKDVEIISNIDIEQKEQTGYNIEPMLLIPFVENAFKHGTGYPHRTFVLSKLIVREDTLVFNVKNKFDPNTYTSKDEISGIGLGNVRLRLEILYPGRHDLEIQTGNSQFCIQLTLKLL